MRLCVGSESKRLIKMSCRALDIPSLSQQQAQLPAATPVAATPDGGAVVDFLNLGIGPLRTGIFNVAGKFYALANKCPHKGGPLCSGRITGLALSGGPGDYKLSR